MWGGVWWLRVAPSSMQPLPLLRQLQSNAQHRRMRLHGCNYRYHHPLCSLTSKPSSWQRGEENIPPNEELREVTGTLWMMCRMYDRTRYESQHVVGRPREIVTAVSFRNQVDGDHVEQWTRKGMGAHEIQSNNRADHIEETIKHCMPNGITGSNICTCVIRHARIRRMRIYRRVWLLE